MDFINFPKRIHVIGICGVATSALAIAFNKCGVKVTGSDKGFFPPISTELEKQGVPYYAGWHPEKMLENGKPDLVMAGGSGTSPSNPEIVFAKENGIPVLSFAETLGKFLIRKNSIVAAGTWGKTSNSALLSSILIQAGMKPSYFTGGVSLSHASAEITDSEWSVVEGDEYQAAIWDRQAKFFYYKPTHLLLSAVSWDHADLYPTEDEYFLAFKKLLGNIPDDGLIVACADSEGVVKIIDSCKGKKIFYGRARAQKNTLPPLDYSYKNVSQSSKGLSLTIVHDGQEYKIQSPMLGLYQSENITGCFAMAAELGNEPEKIIEAITGFKGLKRRMEKRLDGEASPQGITVIDDIAHSPEKAGSILNTLKSIYDGKVIAVFEPNSGSRAREILSKYDDAFRDADIVVIPRLSSLKVASDVSESDRPIEGDELATIISKTHKDTHYMEDDSTLISFLISSAKKDDVIAFLGSHGFRGMIEETVTSLRRQYPA
jgi:UDP-N-acetylmuramate: L-alanyl-gamma-D-glutamyl-meso-diaminopimelate ligase